MAEAFAVTAIVSSIVQLVDFSFKVVERINEFQKSAQGVPKFFQGIHDILPILADGFNRAKEQLDSDGILENTRKALAPLTKKCLLQVKTLDAIVMKVYPTAEDSPWARGKKAVSSLKKEAEVKMIERTLRENFYAVTQLLLLYRVTTDPLPEPVMPLEPPPYQIPDEELGESLKSPIEKGPELRPGAFLLPFDRDENFINRQGVLEQIDQKFESQRRVAISGMGGVGKSQIAIEYCYRFRELNPHSHVFWAYASTPDRLEQAFKDVARKLKIPGSEDPAANTTRLTFQWLSDEEQSPWLLVIDNADSADMFFGAGTKTRASPENRAAGMARYLPRSLKGSILITTRDKRVGERLANTRPIVIEPMSKIEAETLLRSKVPEDEWSEQDADELLKELSYLPLAITQAAAFINENGDSLRDYLNLLHTSDADVSELLSEEIYDMRRDDENPHSVIRTWKLSFEQIQREKPRAAEILSLMAIFDRQGVPRLLLRKDEETETTFKLALKTLEAFSLIMAESGKDPAFGMHRLVQLSTQNWLLDRGTISKWQDEAVATLANKYPKVEYETWPLCEQLKPHINAVLAKNFTTEDSQLHQARLLDDVSWYERKMGRYKPSFEMGIQALKIREKWLPPDDPWMLDSYETVGHAFKRQCKWEDAKKMLERANAGRERTLGPDHPDTLRSLGDLAYILGEMGDLDSAEKMHRKELEFCERNRGPDNHRTLASLESLASVMMDRKRPGEAEKMYRRVLLVRTEKLGAGHPDTLNSLSNVADALVELKHYAEAQEMTEKVYRCWTLLLGPEHPSTLSTLRRLALLADDQRRPKDAEHFYKQVIEGRVKVLGLEHSKTLSAINDLGVSLQGQGAHRYAEAEEQYRRAFNIRKHTLGATHPKTLVSMDEIAFIAAKQNRDVESEKIYREVLALREAKLGPRHLTTLTSVNNLACTIQNCGDHRLAEAEILHRRAFEGRLAALGPKDPKTLKSMRYLKDLLVMVGKVEESRALSRKFRQLEIPPAKKRVVVEDPESDGAAGPNTPTTDTEPMEGVATPSLLIQSPTSSCRPRVDSTKSIDLLLSPVTETAPAPEVSDRTGATSVVPNLSMPPPPPGPPPLTPQASGSSMLLASPSKPGSKRAREPSVPDLVLPELPERLKSGWLSFQQDEAPTPTPTPTPEMSFS